MNIFWKGDFLSHFKAHKRTIRVMKLTLISLFIFTAGIFASVSSQNTRVNINARNVEIREVLNEIEAQTDYLFIYNLKEIDVKQKTSVKMKNTTVSEVLSKIFDKSDVAYAMEGSNIMLMKNEAREESTQQVVRKITGLVTDSKGEPIIGANIVKQGTSVGTITDLDGNFTIEADSKDIIKVSYIGYLDKLVRIENQTKMTIILTENSQALDEVVVIGYGTAKKSDLTGAMTSVTSESFAEQNVTRVDQVLQGRASGVQITNTVGAPGGDVRIRIRGVNSVLGDNSPLFVIDGFVGADFNMLNPNDIKSVEILKDAASTAIYGSRGANGVILITTKSGNRDGKIIVNYQGDVSLSSVIKKYDMLSAGDYAATVNARNKAIGISDYFTQDEINSYKQNGGFDYQDAIFREAISTQHQLSIAGGTEKTQYRISGNYLNQDGIVENSGYERYTVRTNFLTKYNDKLSFRFNINGSTMNGLNTQSRTGAGNPIVQALAWAPTTDPYDGRGGYLISDPVGSIKTNPLSLIYDTENRNERTFANLMAGTRYELIKGLALDFQVGTDLSFRTAKTFSGNYASNYSPSASVTDNKSVNIQTTTQLSYDKTFNDIHKISAVAVFETQKYTNNSVTASSANLKFADLKYDNLAQAQSYTVGSGFTKWSLLSYLGRVNYSLLDRYLFSVSIRNDGSSKFAQGHKYSTFPSAAIAWNMGNESFIKNLDLFSKLKLRVSWGLTGSQAIEPYATQSTYNTSIYYAFSTGDKTSGIQLGNPGNTGLKWETTEQKDLGLEAGFFNGRLNFEFDYFIKDTRDLLLNQTVPYYVGGGSITSNVGKIRNQGWEMSISGNIINSQNVNWKSDLNLSNVKNTVKDLGEETQIFSNPDITGLNGQPEFIYAVGQPLGSFWGLNYLGPWKVDQATEAAKYGQIPGDARYEDLDGDFAIDGADYKIIGCGLPTTTLGWNNTINVKNFTVNLFLQGVFGIDKQNYTRGMHLMAARDARQSTLAEISERYIPGVNENAYLPAFSVSSTVQPQSTMFLEDASYVRLKNISLGYNFNIKKVGNLKLSLNATNLLTFSKYKGIDPESSNVGGGGSDINQSIDYGAYPNSKTYTLGVDFTF